MTEVKYLFVYCNTCKWVPGIFPGHKGSRCVRLTTLPPSCAVVMKSGNLNFLEPSGPLQACNGTDIPFTLAPYTLRGLKELRNWSEGPVLTERDAAYLDERFAGISKDCSSSPLRWASSPRGRVLTKQAKKLWATGSFGKLGTNNQNPHSAAFQENWITINTSMKTWYFAKPRIDVCCSIQSGPKNVYTLYSSISWE